MYLDEVKIREKALDYPVVETQFMNYLRLQPHVKAVFNQQDIQGACEGDYYKMMIARGYDPRENGQIVVLDEPGFIEYGPTGTSHGTPYAYDTHVPLLFFGWKIPQGQSYEKRYITQIAPTLSQKLQITFPNGSNCEVLPELFR